MADLCLKIGLNKFVRTAEPVTEDILEDIFEAFIGAFSLTFGIFYTRELIISLIDRHKDMAELIKHDDNYKDFILRYFHQVQWGNPIYIRRHTGDFYSEIRNPFGKILGAASGETQVKADQNASEKALEYLGVIVKGEIDYDWINKLEKKEKLVKVRDNKKITLIQNPKNEALSKTLIKQLLGKYNIHIPKECKYTIDTFHEAMTHKSYLKRDTQKRLKLTDEDKLVIKESVKLQSKANDRLKFIGNAVIHYVIGYFLYNQYEKEKEGFLTRVRCRIENIESLYIIAKKTCVRKFVLISQVIEKQLKGRQNVNIVGSGFVSFVGAVYRELGLSIARQYIIEVIKNELDIESIAENETNYKDLVIFLHTKNNWGKPDYRIIKEEGPDHSKVFTIGIYLKNKLMGKGSASSKKKAEQIASKEMLSKYDNSK